MLLDAIYLLATILALPWVAWRTLSGGRPVAAPGMRFTGGVAVAAKPPGASRVWLHGVSVGEVQLLASLAAELRRQADHDGTPIDCVVSSSTTTGLEVAAKRFGADHTFPCPLDFTWAVNRVLDRVRPDLLVLGELELWPTMLARTRRRSIPIVVANARMSPRSAAGYARIRPLVRRMLGHVSLVIARSQADADRFAALGARDVTVTGSMKFDGVRGDRDAPEVDRLRRLAGLAPDDVVFLAGSTQDPEERLAAETYLALRGRHPRLRLVIVPRHVERAAEIGRMLDGLGLAWQQRSHLAEPAKAAQPEVLLVDTTGELGWWWGTAAIAFVGGSLDGKRGGQNMLEPAAYGAAVSFGPQTRNFRDEVRRLLDAGAAVVVADGGELTAFVSRCLDDPTWATELGNRATQLIVSQRGATTATARLILDQLPTPAASTARPRIA
ncbi:MAG: 3-deoxy-D-manno-octulosonic acid transferase [Planctomycetia bacterium]|nr:3-deoxy-D-manno-octulosonic acid transferase [Planctomycetia bacterium]